MKCGRPYCACVGTCFAQHSPLDDNGQLQGPPMATAKGTEMSTKPETAGERAELIRKLDYIWECIYDHGAGKYKGPISKAQRDNAYAMIEELKAAMLAADGKTGGEVTPYGEVSETEGAFSAWDGMWHGGTLVYTRPQQE